MTTIIELRELEERLAMAELALRDGEAFLLEVKTQALARAERAEAERDKLRALLLSIVNAIGLPARGRAIAAAADAMKDAP
jgi:hypothetical protein